MRTILITGGTSGLGRALAERIAGDPGVHLVVTGRSPGPGDVPAGAEPMALDLGSLASVQAFAGAMHEGDRPPLGAIVCNAGIQVTSAVRSADGHELTFAVNQLGHVALISRLLDLMGPGGRIVLLGSGTHDPDLHTGMPAPRLEPVAQLRDPGADRTATDGRRRYSTSKLLNVMTAYDLARRLAPQGIDVNAYDPGLMPGTGLARDAGPVGRLLWRTVARAAVLLPGAATPSASAAHLDRLVRDPAWAGRTGRYVSLGRERRSSAQSYDVAAQRALVDDCLALAGLPGALPAEPAPVAA